MNQRKNYKQKGIGEESFVKIPRPLLKRKKRSSTKRSTQGVTRKPFDGVWGPVNQGFMGHLYRSQK